METLRVTVCFEFDGIKDPNSPVSDRIINVLTNDTEQWRTDYGASAVWIDETEVTKTITATEDEQ